MRKNTRHPVVHRMLHSLCIFLSVFAFAASSFGAPPPGKGGPPGGGTGGGTNIAQGTYTFLAGHSGMALTASGTANGSALGQWFYNGGQDQQWQVIYVGNGEYQILNVASGLAMDVAYASSADGAAIIVWTPSLNANQRWTFQDEGNGYCSISPVHVAGKCIEVDAAAANEGAPVVQGTSAGLDHQVWLLQQLTPSQTVACVGDSITYGYGLANRNLESYPAQLQVILGSNYVVNNWGVNSATALKRSDLSYWNTSQYADSMSSNPDFVVIMLGTNDSKTRNWNERNFKRDLTELINSYAVLPSQPQVYVCLVAPIYEPTAFGSDFDAVFVQTTVLPAISEVATQTGTPLIDNNTPLQGRPDLFPDGVHPIAEGAGIIAQNVANAMAAP